MWCIDAGYFVVISVVQNFAKVHLIHEFVASGAIVALNELYVRIQCLAIKAYAMSSEVRTAPTENIQKARSEFR
jgi:hypothetical protein